MNNSGENTNIIFSNEEINRSNNLKRQVGKNEKTLNYLGKIDNLNKIHFNKPYNLIEKKKKKMNIQIYLTIISLYLIWN